MGLKLDGVKSHVQVSTWCLCVIGKCDHSLKHFGDLVCNFTGNNVKIAVASGKNMRPSSIKVCCPLTSLTSLELLFLEWFCL